jgi:hypothetical protein
MTPHPLAAWVQMTVSPQRHVTRDRRRRAARLVLLRRARQRAEAQRSTRRSAEPAPQPAPVTPAAAPKPPRVPEQRRPVVLPPSVSR